MSRAKKPITDEGLVKWLGSLKRRQTALTYGASIVRLLDMMKMNSDELFALAQNDPKGTWIRIVTTARQGFKSEQVGRMACFAARAFLFYKDTYMMLPPSKLQNPDAKKPPTFITWEDSSAIIGQASPPYNIIFKLMRSVGWGLGEFLQFNKAQTWQAIKATLVNGSKPEYFKYGFLRRKKNRHPFHSLIPIEILQEAVSLEAAGKLVLPLSHKTKDGKTTMPIDDTRIETCRRYLDSAFATALKRAPIVVTQGKPSVHELRDCFLTRAVQVGCSESAAKFSMGHTIDPLGYNKSFRDEKWLWSELKKIHGPAAATTTELEALRAELREYKKTSQQRMQETWERIEKEREEKKRAVKLPKAPTRD